MKRLFFCLALGTCCSASAATFTVVNTSDSGAGSLRAALNNANAAPGPNLIAFNLPGTNLSTIAPLTALPVISNPLTLDGYTQPGSQTNNLTNGNNATLLVRLDGTNLPSFTSLLTLTGSGHLVRGLILVHAPGNGIMLSQCSGSTVAGNWIGLDADNLASGNTSYGIYINAQSGPCSGNLIGGSTPDARNVISGNSYGVYLFPAQATANVIAGNFIGTDATGTLPRGNGFGGVFVQAGVNNVIGGASSTARNVISGNGPFNGAAGIYVLAGNGTRIQNNFIGTDVSGTYDLGNGGDGIGLQASAITGCLIGGNGAGNLIVNNRGNGIYVLGAATNTITGNTIGVDLAGQRALGNAASGITINSAAGNIIGGTGPGAANVIRFNNAAGVSLQTQATNTPVRGNVLTDNRGLSLDRGAYGLTNAPVITNAVIQGGFVQLSGLLSGPPAASFTLDFYAAPKPALSGAPQAQVYLGSTTVPIGATGNGSFNVTLPASLTSAWMFSATSTDAAQNTSELSPGFASVFLPAPSLVLQFGGAAGGGVVSWPSGVSGSSAPPPYHLETTYSLSAPINWRLVNNGIQDNGTVKWYSVSNNPLATNQFFRLSQ